MMNVIGLDIGTTSLCGICCDACTGEIKKKLSCANDSFLPTDQGWEKIQDGKKLLSQVLEIAEELIREGGEVCAIGITGQMHGIVYLDEKGEAVSPLYIWQDGRGDQPFGEEPLTYAEVLSRRTGYPLATGYGAVTHFYNTVKGLVPPGAKCFCTIHDLAAMALTGRTSPLLHPSDAASLGLYDNEKQQFDREAIRRAGMDPAFFPEVQEGSILVGKTGQGIPVAAAIGDNQASVLGSLKDLEGNILVNVGTGSQISCVLSKIPKGCDMDCRPLVDGRYLLAGSSLCGGRAYAILERFFRETAELVAKIPVESAYEAMGSLMAQYAKPEHPLRVDTAFSGTRQEPGRRGSISGIGIDNLTMANLCDGVMNGMVEELHTLYLSMKPLLEQTPVRLVGSGNGIRQNQPLAQRFSEVFGLPLEIPAHREEAAFGAALSALVAAGVVSDWKEAQKLIRYQEK